MNKQINPSTLIFFLIVGLVFSLFYREILYGWTFIGDSDRLNTFLNNRLIEIDSIKNLGYVPSWSDHMFMGVNLMGLHFMLPGTSLVAYFESLFPREYLFRIMTLVTASLLVLVIFSAYFYILVICKKHIIAITGAFVYGLSAYALQRLSQLDASFVILFYLPVLFLLLRKLNNKNILVIFFFLTIINIILLMQTFLQEVAYISLVIGLYSIFRSYIKKNVQVFLIYGCSFFIAILFSSPRIYTIFLDFHEIDRSKFSPFSNWEEVFRYFDVGIFGRLFEESSILGNPSINLHEGLQLSGSIMAGILVLWFLLKQLALKEKITGILAVPGLAVLMCAFLKIVFPKQNYLMADTHTILFVCSCLVLAGFLFIVRKKGSLNQSSNQISFQKNYDEDIPFHIGLLSLVLCVVLIPDIRHLFYLLFFKIDFSHTRFSIAGLLPFSILCSWALVEFSGGMTKKTALIFFQLILIFTIVFFYFLYGSDFIFDYFKSELRSKIALGTVYARTESIIKISLSICILFISLYFLWCKNILGQYLLVSIILIESFLHANFILSGPQTLNQHSPFESHAFLKAHPNRLHPPSFSELKKFNKIIEGTKYRSVTVTEGNGFQFFVSPHLASFWGLRLLDGYSAGVPSRLAALPWPEGIRSLRAISFNKIDSLPWKLLALLNVKYAILASQELVYNYDATTGLNIDLDKIKILENPFPVLSRAFFSESVTPGYPTFIAPIDLSVSGINLNAVINFSKNLIELKWHSLYGQTIEVQKRSFESLKNYPVTIVSTNCQGLKNGLHIDGSGRFIRVQPLFSNQLDFRKQQIISIEQVSGLEMNYAVSTQMNSKGWFEGDFGGVKNFTSVSIKTFDRCINGDNDEILLFISDHQITEFDTSVIPPYISIEKIYTGMQGYTYHFSKDVTPFSLKVRACLGDECSKFSNIITVSNFLNKNDLTCYEFGCFNKNISKNILESSDSFALNHFDPLKTSYVEGIKKNTNFGKNLDEPTLVAIGSSLRINFPALDSNRFIVINELYNPNWVAYTSDGIELPIYPTNAVMMGLFLPKNTSEVRLEFKPFLIRPMGIFIMIFSIILFLILCIAIKTLKIKSKS